MMRINRITKLATTMFGAAAAAIALSAVSAGDGLGENSITGVSALLNAQDDSKARTGDVYTLTTCPVSQEPLGSMGDPVVKVYDGREFRFCCGNCIPKFEADRAKYVKRIDAAMIEDQLDDYPLDVCVVSGEKLGSMGEPVNVIYGNRLVRLCCASCRKSLERSGEALIEKLDEAVIAAQKDNYPLETCVVSGEKLGSMGEPVNYVVASRLVRFCCQGCVKSFEKEPAKFLDSIETKRDTDGG